MPKIFEDCLGKKTFLNLVPNILRSMKVLNVTYYTLGGGLKMRDKHTVFGWNGNKIQLIFIGLKKNVE